MSDHIPTRQPDELGRSYGDALAAALATDLAAHPVDGALVRVVIRWFWEGDPAYLTLHALGDEDESPENPADSWYPLEWPNANRELARTDRVLADSGLQQASAALYASLEMDHELGVPVDELAHVPGIYHALRQLPGHLEAAGVGRDPRFVATAAHFEGWGCRHALQHTAVPELVQDLAAQHELPAE